MEINKANVITTVTSAVTAVNVGTSLYKQFKEYSDKRRYFTVSIEGDMFVFPELMEYINSGETKGKGFRLSVEQRQRVRRLYDGDSESTLLINGYKFKVSVRSSDPAAVNMDTDEDDYLLSSAKPKRSLQFRTETEAGVKALENFIEELVRAKRMQINPPSLRSPSGTYWGQSSLPRRDVDSLMLPAGMKEGLLADLEKFRDSEERYLKIGIPWHRGYLLYGPPGNGKSSIVMALANYYNKDLYVLSPNGVKDDQALNNLIREVSRDSLLLIEDIDVFASSVKRDQDTANGPTLAGLLNALDGAYTPHGLVTFITTNRVETLDEALVRPGRIDYRMNLEAPADEQILRSFQHIYEEPLGTTPRKFDSMAEFIGVVKRHRDDPAMARLEIAALDNVPSVL